jgi:Kef-type K+ transport system membrane component KefB
MRKNLLLYFVIILVCGAGLYLTLHYGARLQAGGVPAAESTQSEPLNVFPGAAPAAGAASRGAIGVLAGNLRHPLGILLLQVTVILVAARVIGSLFHRLGQPAVIGEMVAGIVLGPSLLGLLLPAAQAFVFPATSMDTLRLLSQLGVILYMFVIGIELDLQHLRQRAHAALLISHASIIAPFCLGTILALFIYSALAPAHVSFLAFALFMGIAMSITAFPVLARIIEERGLSKSQLGNTAIACAAVDDVTAWCLLAFVVAIAKADGLGSSLLTLILAMLFIGLMLFLFKPRADRILSEAIHGETHSKSMVAGVLIFVFVAALSTEIIGIHALFGAFLAGVIIPTNSSLRSFLRERLETFSSVFLLPLFFAFTGLRTQIGLLAGTQSWLICAGIIAVAIAGKLGASMLAARWTGMSWHESLSLGALMNTRGLMELIVLNIGYDMGILSPRIFVMMVLMALFTTLMTGPVLALLEWTKKPRPATRRMEEVPV